MEKEHVDLMAYAVAMADYDRALTIAKELTAHYVTANNNALASIFEKIGDAVIYRKNKEYDKAQELWREISEFARNIDTTLSVFTKACYYDAIADSTEDDAAKKREYKKKGICLAMYEITHSERWKSQKYGKKTSYIPFFQGS